MQGIPGAAAFFRIFYAITGVGFLVLMWGFTKCLFDIDQISACVDHGEYAFEVFKTFGDHVIAWFIALVQEVFSRV